MSHTTSPKPKEAGSRQDSNSRNSTETHKRRRRDPSELIWTQPRTVPSSLHKNAQRQSKSALTSAPTSASKSTSVSEPTSKEKTIANRPRRGDPPQKSQKAALTNSIKPHCLEQDVIDLDWRAGVDLLDLGIMSDMGDDLIGMDLVHCNSSLSDALDSTSQLLDAHMLLNSTPMHLPGLSSTDGSTDSSDVSPSSGFSLMEASHLNGYSSVHLAAHFGQLSIIHLLLSQSPDDVDLLNHEGQSPLHIAASEGHTQVVHELLQSGANILQQDIDGFTALHLSVAKGYLDTVRLLLESSHCQTLVRLTDNAGKTALHHAVMHGHSQIVQVLLERGANTRTPIR